ncbi:MAG TPA: ABC transporter permease [Candidatus Aminicenantes bacterium]|nr:ABC transporter permease [Candidatus Aminicenantes bacterium]
MKNALKEIASYRELLGNLIVTELKLRYRESFLGFLWTVLNPLFFLLVLALVFSQIIKFQMENYTIFLFAGMASYLTIQQTVLIATGSIVNNQGLIKKVSVPKIIFPLSNVLARFVDHIALVLILLLFMVYFRMDFNWSLISLVPLMLLHFLFSLGFSLLASVVYIRVRDVQHILSIGFQAFFYLSPIIYPAEILPKGMQKIFLFNPFYYFIQSFRYPIYHGRFPPLMIWSAAFFLTVVVLGLGLWVFYKKEKSFVFQLS